MNPLHLAAWYNDNPEVIQTLLENGAPINSNTGWGDNGYYTALHLAARNNENPAVVQTLLDYGANINELTNRSGANYTPLSVAIQYNNDLPVIQVLLDYGADIREGELRCDRASPEAILFMREEGGAPKVLSRYVIN